MVSILSSGRLLSKPAKSGDPATGGSEGGGGGGTGPGGASDVLLLSNGMDSLLLTDGTSFLKLASSS